MNEPMSAPMASAGGPRASSACPPNPSQSPGYHSAASSPSSSSISSPISSSSSSSSSSGLASGVSSTSSAISSSFNSPQHNSSPPANSSDAASAAATTNGAQTTTSATDDTTQSSVQVKHEPMSMVASKQSVAATNRINRQQQANSGAANMSSSLFDFFPELNYDGAMITWFQGANNRASLTTALMSNKMFISGDISLAEMSRYPVPIMARPPLGVSDLTLENWLTDMTRSQRGIKLTFTSTRTVEPAFRVLARHAEHLKGPLILSADILTRPSTSTGQQWATSGRSGKQQLASHQQQQQQPVDAWTFLMLCRTRFPKSIVSIGWCSAQTSGESSSPSASTLAGVTAGALPSDSMFELDIEHQHQQHNEQQSLMQQLAAAAAQAHHLLPQTLAPQPGQAQANSPSMHANYQHLNQHLNHLNNVNPLNNHHHHHHHHHLQSVQRINHHKHLSSSGSLSSSSSGNSSGSPSPTSPLSHLAHHGHHNYLGQHQRLHNSFTPSESPEHQLILAAAAAAASHQGSAVQSKSDAQVDWPAAVAAAAMVAASSLQHQDNQLPLNLNINEADPKHATTLSDLAHRIHSIQRHQGPTSASMSINRIQQQHLAMANKLISAKQTNATNWQHINKKAAITSCLNSNSPSPISTSPKQSQQHKSTANLLCVSKTQPQQQQQLINAKQTIASATGAPAITINHADGYSREMIDKMAALVKEYNLTQPITFPVEASLLLRDNNSLNELQRLLYQVGSNSTLTIVAQPEDLIGVDDLLRMRKHFSPQQILFDLPEDLAAALRQEIDLV